MKSYKLIAAALLIIVAATSITATAKEKKKYKNMYVFGVSTSFNDSTVYFTTIQEIDSVASAGKTGMLENNQEYSYQLRNYFSNNSMPHRTCVIINKSKKKDIEKLNAKMRQKFTKKENFLIKNLSNDDFKFERVVMAE